MKAKHNSAVILLGGEITPTLRLKAQAQDQSPLIIAADGGIRHAAPLGITPHIWLGDFDSVPHDQSPDQFIGAVETHHPDKAQTDGELAIEKALALGAQKLILIGALSGERSDHMLLHIPMAIALVERGLDIMLTSGGEEAIPLSGYHGPMTIRPDWPTGNIFSLIGYSDIEGLTLEGMQWPLIDHSMSFGSTLTLSNVIDTQPQITLTKGRALAITIWNNP